MRMSKAWSGSELADLINGFAPDAAVDFNDDSVWIKPADLVAVMERLKQREDVRFDLLVNLTAVDYIDHFEMVYRLRSLLHNTTAVVKSKSGYGRTFSAMPSVYSIWRGADLMEREVWDLMGVKFEGHPNLKRIMLWEGFRGHPLRKDFAVYEDSLKSLEEMERERALAEQGENGLIPGADSGGDGDAA